MKLLFQTSSRAFSQHQINLAAVDDVMNAFPNLEPEASNWSDFITFVVGVASQLPEEVRDTLGEGLFFIFFSESLAILFHI